jgi:hypothetical protein
MAAICPSAAALTVRAYAYPFPIPDGGFRTDMAPAVRMDCCVYPDDWLVTVTLFLVSESS